MSKYNRLVAVPIQFKILEVILKCFGYVQKREIEASTGNVQSAASENQCSGSGDPGESFSLGLYVVLAVFLAKKP